MRRARGYKASAASGTSATHPEPGPRRSEEILKYRGEPNGLKIHRDGRIFIADHEQGLLILDPASGTTRVALDRPYAERFKGLNDLLFARNGDCYFTDQGESDQRDPTGRLFRLRASGELDCLLDNVPSPNGLVLTPDESSPCPDAPPLPAPRRPWPCRRGRRRPTSRGDARQRDLACPSPRSAA
jgi:sugar lactone lactonase YvrE